MKASCEHCALCYEAHKTDYTKVGTGEEIDSVIDGYICMAFARERIATLMVGLDPTKGMCEMWTERKGN